MKKLKLTQSKLFIVTLSFSVITILFTSGCAPKRYYSSSTTAVAYTLPSPAETVTPQDQLPRRYFRNTDYYYQPYTGYPYTGVYIQRRFMYRW